MQLPFSSPLTNVGVLFIASMLYGAFLILFILSTLVLHHQCKQNKCRSSGRTGTIIYLTLGYLLFSIITTVCRLSHSASHQIVTFIA